MILPNNTQVLGLDMDTALVCGKLLGEAEQKGCFHLISVDTIT
jgi:hypothetical protein